MPLHVSSTCAHHQEVKIALHSLWYHHTPSIHRCSDHDPYYTVSLFCVVSWTQVNNCYSVFV